MNYVVTKNNELFENELYTIISVQESLDLLNSVSQLQFDTETTGLDSHLDKLLSMQFGNDSKGFRILIDCTTITPSLYKEIVESKLLIGHNLKFDLQFLYTHNMIPRKVYDTMIAEQTLYLGVRGDIKVTPQDYKKYHYTFPYGIQTTKEGEISYYYPSYALKAVAKKYLNVDMDKSVRGEIIWRGLDNTTINYALTDVVYLEQIAKQQIQKAKEVKSTLAVNLECNVVPAMAYLEWCGIKMDIPKWQQKMKEDLQVLQEKENALNQVLITKALEEKPVFTKRKSKKDYVKLKDFISFTHEIDLFNPVIEHGPRAIINWKSSPQVIAVCKLLGFNTTVQDKKTKEDKDSVLEKVLKPQKGICDEFLNAYLAYRGAEKLCSTYGQGHLNSINPITNRLHTVYTQIGTKSGRMSSGSSQKNESVARYKHLSAKDCPLVNMQQVPKDARHRSCFIAEKGNLFCSCDYSAKKSLYIFINISRYSY